MRIQFTNKINFENWNWISSIRTRVNSNLTPWRMGLQHDITRTPRGRRMLPHQNILFPLMTHFVLFTICIGCLVKREQYRNSCVFVNYRSFVWVQKSIRLTLTRQRLHILTWPRLLAGSHNLSWDLQRIAYLSAAFIPLCETQKLTRNTEIFAYRQDILLNDNECFVKVIGSDWQKHKTRFYFFLEACSRKTRKASSLWLIVRVRRRWRGWMIEEWYER